MTIFYDCLIVPGLILTQLDTKLSFLRYLVMSQFFRCLCYVEQHQRCNNFIEITVVL